mmetsp:Transcript_12175/g.37120  ORF Transcript_12175/g.37120 Transcript_12175/m.37120 type:complete len:124 (-) Transcript_12175:78-449(-)
MERVVPREDDKYTLIEETKKNTKLNRSKLPPYKFVRVLKERGCAWDVDGEDQLAESSDEEADSITSARKRVLFSDTVELMETHAAPASPEMHVSGFFRRISRSERPSLDKSRVSKPQSRRFLF